MLKTGNTYPRHPHVSPKQRCQASVGESFARKSAADDKCTRRRRKRSKHDHCLRGCRHGTVVECTEQPTKPPDSPRDARSTKKNHTDVALVNCITSRLFIWLAVAFRAVTTTCPPVSTLLSSSGRGTRDRRQRPTRRDCAENRDANHHRSGTPANLHPCFFERWL